jgi:hypothetical protein
MLRKTADIEDINRVCGLPANSLTPLMARLYAQALVNQAFLEIKI